MRLLSVDPGLDAIAIARWDLARPSPTGALLGVHRILTDGDLPLPQRLNDLAATFARLVRPDGLTGLQALTVVVIEMPGSQAIYQRNQNPAVMKAVVTSMLDSSLATGVLLAESGHATHCLALQADTTPKAKKQAIADLFLREAHMPAPAAPRRVWSGDELDAVYVGLRHFQRARLLLTNPPAQRIP